MPTLKELRRYRFMSQMDLAKKAGVASITISRLERGIQKPSLQTIRKLADALEVEVADIVLQQWSKEDEDEAERQRLETEVEVVTIEGDLADRLKPQKPPLPKEEAEEPVTKLEIEEEQVAPAQVGEIKPEAKVEESAKSEAEAVEGATSYDSGVEEDLREGAGDEMALESTLFPRSRAAGELEPERATLATASVLPLGLLGSKKAWVWIVVLACVATAVYFLWRSHLRKGEVASPPKEPVKNSGDDPVRDFLDNY